METIEASDFAVQPIIPPLCNNETAINITMRAVPYKCWDYSHNQREKQKQSII